MQYLSEFCINIVSLLISEYRQNKACWLSSLSYTCTFIFLSIFLIIVSALCFLQCSKDLTGFFFRFQSLRDYFFYFLGILYDKTALYRSSYLLAIFIDKVHVETWLSPIRNYFPGTVVYLTKNILPVYFSPVCRKSSDLVTKILVNRFMFLTANV